MDDNSAMRKRFLGKKDYRFMDVDASLRFWLCPRFSLCLLFSFIGWILAPVAVAAELSSSAYGDNQHQARERARSSLASQIFVTIESDSELYDSTEGGSYFTSSVLSKTDLPLFGVDLDCHKASGQQYCTALMDTEKALPLYEKKLADAITDINILEAKLNSVATAYRHDHLSNMLSIYEQFDKYSIIVNYLGGQLSTVGTPSISKQELKSQLVDLEHSVASLQLAAELISRDIDYADIYVKPLTLENSREVTPFSTAMLKHVKSQLQTTDDIENANYFLSGYYQIHKKGIQVQYSLKDKKGDTLQTSLVELAPGSYENYRIKPASIDFDQLLHKGYVIKSDFRVEINTNKGSRQLLFLRGEQIEILAKLNRAGYFYIVGHSKNDVLEQSYLLAVNGAGDDRKFIFYVNADDANRWISLGKFEVIPPFGVESIQVFASEKDPVGHLPGHQYNPDSQYYVVSTNIAAAVRETRIRGLKLVSSGKDTIVEDVLTFTTQP